MGNESSTEQPCADRAMLSLKLSKAVSSLYARKAEYRAAKKKKDDTVNFSIALQLAIDEERTAENAYRQHIEQHGCKH